MPYDRTHTHSPYSVSATPSLCNQKLLFLPSFFLRTRHTTLLLFFFFFLMIRPPPRSPLFPYTTLSRSLQQDRFEPLRSQLRPPLLLLAAHRHVRRRIVGQEDLRAVSGEEPVEDLDSTLVLFRGSR